MKKLVKFLSIICIFTLVIPITVQAETLTYGQVLDELARAQKELNENNQSIDNTNSQINQNSATVKNLQSEIESMQEENTKLQQEIADATVEIETKREEIKDTIAYLQVSQGENVYLEYVFGSDSITDMVYRLSIVEQITEYNEQVIEEMENLITTNENRKTELAEKEKKAESKIENLNSEISKLNNNVSSLSSLTPSLKDEVEAKQKLVTYYKEQGCSNRSDVIGVDCAKTSANAVFSRPLKSGYVTSFTGYRGGELHRGIDLGSSTGLGTPLYSIGTGVVRKKWTDLAGALNINIEYKDTNGVYYTAIYSHLSRYASGIYEGMKVTSDTIVGYMGATGKATGVHLHLEVYPCRLWGDSQCSTWDKYVKFATQQFKSGYKGSESVISFPSRSYQTWYSR